MRLLRRPMAAILLVWLLPACAGTARWRTHEVTPQETKRTVYAGDVRVITTDGKVHLCRGVWVSPDSLGGWLQEPAGAELTFALADVRFVQTRFAGGGTAGPSSTTTVRGVKDGQDKLLVMLAAALVVALVAAVNWFVTWDGPFGSSGT